jgi:hypothetical protein
MSEYSNPDLPENLSAMGIYTKFTEGKYHRINTKQVLNNRDYYVEKVNAKFYKFITGQNEYEKVPPEATLDMNENYYVEEIKRTYKDIERNGSYKTEKLFKIAEADPNVAFTQEIENVLIEKFRQTEVHIYKEASEQEIAEHNLNELFIKTEEGYKNPPDKNQNVPYYLFERKTSFVSVGYEVD